MKSSDKDKIEFCKMQLNLNIQNRIIQMINQEGGGSNQYGFYAVPKALQPKKKYRETYEYEDEYSDEDDEDSSEKFEEIQRTIDNEQQLQRDFYYDEAPYPQFKPRERGLDYGVQIDKTDLFDFEMQVQPLIQILVGRSVVSAINQLQQQKQTKERKQGLDQYQKKRNAELMVTQRMETKNKRKKQEVERRKLQKEIFVKNQKQAGKKLISRRNAKHSLLNLKKQVLEDLQQEGFLRKQPYSDLRIQYEGWLYEQIQSVMKQQQQTVQVIENMVHGKERETVSNHSQYINKERDRRQKIYDERQRVRKANEERKRKKKIRKQRLALNNEHKPNAQAVNEQVQKYETVPKVLKCSDIGNGRTNTKNNSTTLQISGGLFNYVIAYLNSLQKQHTLQQVQQVVQKLLSQLQTKLQVCLSQQHQQQYSQVKAKLEEDEIAFMKNKQTIVSELMDKIGLDFSILQSLNIYVKSSLHNGLLQTILNICLNALPSPKKQGEQIVDSYEATEKDKKRQELKHKIQVKATKEKDINEIKNSQNIVRVHFNKVRPQSSQKSQKQQEQQKEKSKEQLLDEWIDVYDGENWDKHIKEKYTDADRNTQSATSYNLNGFNNALVVDQRNMFYLRNEIQKLLDAEPGTSLNNYEEGLQNIRDKVGQVPVFDVQLQWE